MNRRGLGKQRTAGYSSLISWDTLGEYRTYNAIHAPEPVHYNQHPEGRLIHKFKNNPLKEFHCNYCDIDVTLSSMIERPRYTSSHLVVYLNCPSCDINNEVIVFKLQE